MSVQNQKNFSNLVRHHEKLYGDLCPVEISIERVVKQLLTNESCLICCFIKLATSLQLDNR